ncbi:MAG: acetate--CoA ligase family protein, partial [Bacteroidota bacterium]
MVVIFGTPGLFDIYDVYELLAHKISNSRKPIYPVLPSVLTAKNEVDAFVTGGGVYFPDEVTLGNALVRVSNTEKPSSEVATEIDVDIAKIRSIIDGAKDGYLPPEPLQQLLDAAGINRALELVVSKVEDIDAAAKKVGFPLVMKVVGPVHKSDVGGVSLNIKDMPTVISEMERMMNIADATGVLLQPMLSGTELFAGVNKEDKFGHMLLFGLGGIFIEVLKDVRAVLAPISKVEVIKEIKKLRSYKIIQGVRGMDPVDEDKFAEIIVRLSALVQAAPEIVELDLNPLLGSKDNVVAVDARVRVEKK